MITRESTLVSRDGTSLYTVNWLPDSKPKAAICIIHGIGEHIGRYSHVAETLTKAGYLVFGFDLRGHGKSGGRIGDIPSFDCYMGDLDIFLQTIRMKVADISVFLYGHSMGGNIVTNYVIRRKPCVSGIILSCPGFLPASIKSNKYKFLVVQILERVVPMLMISNGIDPTDLSRDSGIVSRYLNDPLVHDRISLRLCVSIVDAGKFAVREAVRFNNNLLFLQGGADHVVDVATNIAFAHNVSGQTQLKVWPELFHEIHNEPERQIVFSEIIEWLDKTITTKRLIE